jgi:hypothetical protein
MTRVIGPGTNLLKLNINCYYIGGTMKLIAAICTLVTMVTPRIAACDEQFRCGSWLVSTQTSVAELLQKCGEPSSRQVSTEDARAHVAGGGSQKVGTTTTEIWHYDRGSKMLVTIVDGTIQSIERGK